MAITTLDIPDIGSPPDDPTLELDGILYIPDPLVHAPPYHCMVGTVDLTFKIPTLSTAHPSAMDLAAQGFLTLSFHVRVRPSPKYPTGIPGQTTPAYYPTHTDDYKFGIRYMRPGAEIETEHGFSVTGFVGGWGGSGSGYDTMVRALLGTVGDDRLDAAICLSPVTDGGDPDGTAQLFDVCSNYMNTTDMAELTSFSPVSFINDHDFHILHYNGDNESMPISQLTLMQQAMATFGATATEYESHLNTGNLGTLHAYKSWTGVRVEAITWMQARAAEFLDEEPPPPPEETGRVLVTALITGMSPDVEMQLHVTPINSESGLEGPEQTFNFTSDPAETGGGGFLKDPPTGVFVLIDAPNGTVIPEELNARAWWDYSYVDGARYPIFWSVINGFSKNTFNWVQLDGFLAQCASKNKMAGISVDCGIHSPAWVYNLAIGFTEHGPNSGVIPLPWDQNYLKAIKNMIVTMATRYDANTDLGYIVMGGMGQLLETLVVLSVDYPELNAIAQAAGYADVMDGWTFSAQQICDMWIKAFRTTHCYLAIEHPVPAANGGLTGIDGFVRAAIGRYKASLGLTNFGLDGLTAATNTLSLNKIIRNATRSARSYRFNRPSSDPACDPGQEPELYDAELGLQHAADAGIALGVQAEEFYESDILTLTDNYPTHFATFQTDLIANAVA